MVRPTIEIHNETEESTMSIVTPPPTVFSHELVVDEQVGPSPGPTGVLTIGTRVLLMGIRGDRCWVVDGVGRHVEVNRSSLRALPD
jgi:hypothetical protein